MPNNNNIIISAAHDSTAVTAFLCSECIDLTRFSRLHSSLVYIYTSKIRFDTAFENTTWHAQNSKVTNSA